MKIRWSALFLILALLLGACGNKNKRPDQKLVTERDPVRSFMAAIPAETPYAFVATDPMPLGPWLRFMGRFSDTQRGLLGGFGQVVEDDYVDPSTRLIFAILDELSGNYSAEGLRSLGLSASPRFALYGIGVLPALRFDLEDVDAFVAFLDRVEERSGLTRTRETIGDSEFWTYPSEGGGFLVMAILGRQLVVGATPVESAESYTRYLLGESLPETSLADVDTIDELMEKHGLQKYGAGFFDLRRLAQIFLEPEPGINDEVTRLALPDAYPAPSQTCVEESMELVNQAPRIVFGYEDWATDSARIGVGLELHNDVGAQLKAAKAPTPVAGTEFADKSPLFAAFGVHVGTLVELARTKAMAVRDRPFACEWFGDLNRAASEIAMYAATVPPLVTNLRGGAVVLHDVQPDRSGSAPQTASPRAPQFTVEGVAMAMSSSPTSLFDFLRSFVPEYLSLSVKPDGRPVPLPPAETLTLLEMPHVVLTREAVGITSGDAMVEIGTDLVASSASDGGPYAVLAYDLNALWKIAENAGAQTPSTMGASLFGGRTEIVLEPRDDALFIHADLEFVQ